MREFFSIIFLICLQVTSLLLSAVGSAFSSAGSLFHIFFVTRATRHDNRYALRPEEKEHQQPKALPQASSDTTVLN